MPHTTTIPGLAGGPLTTSFPVKTKLIPKWRTLNRPGIKASRPRRSVQHGNGNPNSTAAGEANYLFNGAGGRQASYHSAADDLGVYVMVPADEVTWQAADGSGPGNLRGFSCELVEDRHIWADPKRRARCIEINAEWMGRVAARLDIAKPEQHWDFNFNNPPSHRHDCPNQLRHVDGAWDTYVSLWHRYKAEEERAMQGKPPAPTPAPAPGYAAPVQIDALLATDLKKGDTAEGIITADGTEFVFVADVVEARRDTPRLRNASGTEVIGPPIKKGERFVVAWVFKFGEEFFYLTPFWTRVKYEDTKRVSDAPPGGEGQTGSVRTS